MEPGLPWALRRSSRGLGFREWGEYADTTFIGKWSLSARSSLVNGGAVDMFPLVAQTIAAAANDGEAMPEEWADCRVGTSRAAWALNRAWWRMRDMAR